MPGYPMQIRIADDNFPHVMDVSKGDRSRFINEAIRSYIREQERTKTADKKLKKEIEQSIVEVSALKQELEEDIGEVKADVALIEQHELPELKQSLKELTARVEKLEGKKKA